MVVARFIGDPRHDGDGPASIEMWGHTFVKGVWTELTSELAERKARGSDHFEVSDVAKPEKVTPPEPVKAPEPEVVKGIPANWRELHHSSRIKLAKSLDADLADTIKTVADADQVIEWHEGKDNG
jgi:hypothetical protein